MHIYVFSDIELGSGTVTDDFSEDELLQHTIEQLNPNGKATLVFNGDTLDFMKVPYRKKYPVHITQDIAVDKLKRIQKAHPTFFTVCRDWCAQGHRIVFIYGNHDFDLVFPKVQDQIVEYIGASYRDQIVFSGFEWVSGPVRIEHGSQLDNFFKVDPDKLLIEKARIASQPFLKLPWMYTALYKHHIQLKEDYPLLEKVKPRDKLLKHLPLDFKRKYFWGSLRYVLYSFFIDQWRRWSDPLSHMNLKDLGYTLQKLMRNSYHLEVLKKAKRSLRRSKYSVLCIGHNHEAQKVWVGNKVILNTGNWRDEYFIEKNMLLPRPKTYADIYYENTVKHAELIYVPSSLPLLPLSRLYKDLE